MFKWDDLDYWDTGEFQVVEEHLDDLDRAGSLYNPKREDLFAALDAVPLEKVKVMICGQDPYPDRELATGIAFSIPQSVKKLPPTLNMIFDEYCSDLHYPRPTHGSLLKWCEEGVLLWNVIPSCLTGHSLSHDWLEWKLLTDEIILELAQKGIVFIFLGQRAREFSKLVGNERNCAVIETSHPSPRAVRQSRQGFGFTGSRIFTRANDKLVELGLSPVNWRL